jgi:hypothetical protein
VKDVLLYAAVATPWLIGLAVLIWGLLAWVGGVAVGRVLAENERPFDQERQ